MSMIMYTLNLDKFAASMFLHGIKNIFRVNNYKKSNKCLMTLIIILDKENKKKKDNLIFSLLIFSFK